MKLWTLLENTACRQDLTAAHGLSLYLETGGHRILFDMGPSAAFRQNGDVLGIDPAAVDLAILSHGHDDHGGGMAEFLRCNAGAPLYVHGQAFRPHYNRVGKYIGLDPALRNHPRLIFTEDSCHLAAGLDLYTCNDRVPAYPVDHRGLQALVGDRLEPDDFCHEQYLLVQEQGKRILISGCSHKGVCNLVHWFRPDILVGGFHLKDKDPADPSLPVLAENLLRYDTVYYTGHCTGSAQYHRLKEMMGHRLQSFSTGTVLEL